MSEQRNVTILSDPDDGQEPDKSDLQPLDDNTTKPH
jgi:hypothetical protein